jgi:pimeloyl-ACP methyl ester carboxylesterase
MTRDMETSASYTTGAVASEDGTTIGYRQLGHGPGVVLVHGGMQAAQNFMKLAAALSDAFTVYVPNRRGRGSSGPHGDDYSLAKECEDLHAVVSGTGARNVFGLSSGAIVVLQAALTLPSIQRIAIYEPPLSVGGSTPTAWVPRLDREIDQGKLASAMVTVIKGTQDSTRVGALPRFILVPLMKLAISAEARSAKDDDVPLKALIPTMRFDPRLVAETADTLEKFKALRAEVLLLGGSRSAAYLRTALDALRAVLPHAERVEFPGLDHLAADNHGKPERVAQELRRFFGEPQVEVARRS